MYDNSKGRISPKLLRVSRPMIERLKGFEELMLTGYDDGAGYQTIGWGHRMQPGDPRCITEARAEELLRHDLQLAEGTIRLGVKVPLYQYEFDALVSFIFNIGGGAFLKSTMRVALNDARYDLAADEFKRWNKAGGKVLKGLVRRRAAEETIFRTGTYRE